MKTPPPEFPHDDREARLTALLLGELSPARAKKLEAELAKDADLRALRDQLAETVGLLRETFVEDDAPARLSTGKRDELLGTFKTVRVRATPGAQLRKTPWWQVRVPWVPLAAAACVVFLLAGMLLPSLAKAKAKSPRVAALHEAKMREIEARLAAADAEQAPPLSAFTVPARGDEPGQFGADLYERHALTPSGGAAAAGSSTVEWFGLEPKDRGRVEESSLERNQSVATAASPTAGQNVEFFYRNSAAEGGQRGEALDKLGLVQAGEQWGAWQASSGADPFAPQGGTAAAGVVESAPGNTTGFAVQGLGTAQAGGTGAGGYGDGMMGGGGGFGGGASGGMVFGGRQLGGRDAETLVDDARSLSRSPDPRYGVGLQSAPTHGPAPADELGAAVNGGVTTLSALSSNGRFDGNGEGVVVAGRPAMPGGAGSTRGSSRFGWGEAAALSRPASQPVPAEAAMPGQVDEQMLRRYALVAPASATAEASPPPTTGLADRRQVVTNDFTVTAPVPPPVAGPMPPFASVEARSPGQPITWNMPVPAGVTDYDVDGEGAPIVAMTANENRAFSKGASVAAEAGGVYSVEATGYVNLETGGRASGLAVRASETDAKSDGLNRRDLKERYAQEFDSGVNSSLGTIATNGSVPVLGDLPMGGRLFRSETVVDFEAAPPMDSGALSEGEEELAPLPLKLPIPAFMGTPTDLRLNRAPSPVPASEIASGAMPSLKRQGGAAPASQVERLRRTDVKASDVTRKLAELEGEALSESARLSPPDSGKKVRVAALQQQLAEQRRELEVEGLSEQLSAVAGKPAAPSASARAKLVEEQARQQVEDLAKRIPAPPPAEPLPEIRAAENAFSTFSLNVADVTFKLAVASLDQGQMPAPGSVRSEEFVNAFDYRDPEPVAGDPVGFVWERARFPFAHNREVMRFALKTAAQGRETGRLLNLVLLLDSSGSMERADRVDIVRHALAVLGGELQPGDRVSVVTFSSTATLRADGATGAEARQALQRATEVPPEGGTNLEAALGLAYETAKRNFLNGGVNRVVMLTDGAANLGNVMPGELKALVEQNRREGVALDAFGVGWEGYNDDLLEVLTRNGDGRYGFINTPEAAASDFAGQLAGALEVAAADVKVQVEFNPGRVEAYRQVGYQKHQLTKEEFRDNTVDAAEIGAAEQGNALYVAELKADGNGPIGYLRVRYRAPATGIYEEREWVLDYKGPAAGLEQGSPALRLATVAAGFAEWLNGSPFAGEVSLDRLQALVRDIPATYPRDPRPQQLADMLQQARNLGGR